MKLVPTRRTDYGIRALLHLAHHESGWVKAADIAATMEIPQGFLQQVLQELQRSSLVTSRPSRHGGYALARPPGTVSLLDVVEALEGPIEAEECALRGGPCHWDEVCALHWTWSGAYEALRSRLADTTLADLAAQDRALAEGRTPVPPDAHRRAGLRASTGPAAAAMPVLAVGPGGALDLAGRVAIVAGGADGVGREVSEALLTAGAEVVVCSRTEPDAPPAAGERAASHVCADVRDAREIDRVVRAALDRHGRIDVLVHGGEGTFAADAAAPQRSSEDVLTRHLVVPLVFSQQVNAVMQAQPEGGCIVHVVGAQGPHGARPPSEGAAHGAARAGLLDLTRSLAAEFAPRVRVNAVTAERAAGTGPSDVAGVCLFLASPLARSVTGAHIAVGAATGGD